MKMNTLLLYTLLSIAFLVNVINATEKMKSKFHKYRQFNISPNASDISRLIKPMIRTEYKPEEVNSLAQSHKEEIQYPMTNAEIIGAHSHRKGLNEKPTMYATVITPHATSVKHSNPANNVMRSFSGNSGTTSMFNQETEVSRLSEGQLAIPVKIENTGIISDPTLANYEVPSFLSKKHKILSSVPMISPNLLANSAKDLKRIKSKLSSAQTKKQKLAALKSEQKKLSDEAKAVTKQIQAEVGTLLNTKNVAFKMNNLLNRYMLKIKKDELSRINLVDRVEIRKALKAKLIKEIQGFRTGDPTGLVKKVDSKELKKIVKTIKNKLGY